ncbi:bifunctional pyr operon transcriptional regulator/uracil phosphoribosyltransferase PyrR [Corynebacterium pyruviciproducens]
MTQDQSSDFAIVDSGEISQLISKIAHQIVENNTPEAFGNDDVVLLGIPSGGVPLAQRIKKEISEITGANTPIGSLDITLYRDDLKCRPHRALRQTMYPLGGIEGKTVVLIDDVLYSGRTIRAALDALRDLGRAKRVQLAVLVDREQQEFPIRADFVGTKIPNIEGQNLVCELQPLDDCDRITVQDEEK